MGSTQSTWGIYSTLVIMKYTTLALLVAATSAVKIVGDGTPQNQLDYWTREKNDAAAAAKAAADAAQAKKDAAAQAAAAKAAVAHAKALNIESGNVWEHIPNYPGSQPLTNPADVRESNFKASASDISDNTHMESIGMVQREEESLENTEEQWTNATSQELANAPMMLSVLTTQINHQQLSEMIQKQ